MHNCCFPLRVITKLVANIVDFVLDMRWKWRRRRRQTAVVASE
jgi:hypothetical protein